MPKSVLVGVLVAGFLGLHVYVKILQRKDFVAVGSTLTTLSDTGDLARLAHGHRITVITFFETWCGPCQVELPELQKLYAAHNRSGLGVVGVYGATSDSNIQPFVKRLGLTFPLLRDETGQLAHTFGVDAVPTTVVVDAHLKVLHTARGFSAGYGRTLEHLVQQAP